MNRIFVSYCSLNKDYVKKPLLADLESAGYEVWIDHKKLGGGSWWEQILDAISNHDVFLIALSQDWLESDACSKEFEYASALGRHCLPVHLIDVGDLGIVPYSIRRLEMADYRTGSKEQLSDLVRKINAFPPVPPLPDPLPTPPDEPITEIANVVELLYEDVLTADEQWIILNQLEAFRTTPKEASTAHNLLQRMSRRTDLVENVADRLRSLLNVQRQLTTSHGAAPQMFTPAGFSNRARITPPNARRLRQVANLEGGAIRKLPSHPTVVFSPMLQGLILRRPYGI